MIMGALDLDWLGPVSGGFPVMAIMITYHHGILFIICCSF